ncbi:MAG: hypothetical protein EG824_02865 [Deltaproteobacteria bacterium]|nr:hypothetical protein [Deltaproteobacteria bacterium]
MTEDQSVLKSPDTAGILKDPDVDGTASVTPYYWSWYRLVFPVTTPIPVTGRLSRKGKNRK